MHGIHPAIKRITFTPAPPQVVVLNSVGCAVERGTLDTHPVNVNGSVDWSSGCRVPIRECSQDWFDALDDTDADTLWQCVKGGR